MKKVLDYAVMGLGIGYFISTVCLSLMRGLDETMENVLAWMIASVLYGLISMIFDTDWLPLPGMIAVHFCGCVAITLGTAWILGYADSFLSLALDVVPIFIVIYILIGLGIALYARQDTKKLNQKMGK
ncbi:DUF3021 domain-containing protein [Agathobaculum sp.]|uniref:DUF3021 domain-containing protein n=1 Tax=Agathobaculum sp. TaxID=2048138 RepID=UPI002A824CE7|nr:DUF3021 domain-containing protein [Agathobaculum sp.]MDY3618960.1 DUF3021 domain-containing protein [Agathobaculum sp.]